MPLMLMAKLVVLFVLIHSVWLSLPDPFLPFLPALDYFRDAHFGWVLRIAALAGSIAVLFNFRVRAACLVAGSAVLLGILASRPYFHNNTLYLGCLLFLLGLYEPASGPSLIHFQVILVFFAAALNKVLEPSWRNGQFFSYWASVAVIHSWYWRVASRLPVVMPLVMSWLTIATELSLAIGLTFRRYRMYAIWLGLVFFTGMNLLTGQTYGFFFLIPISLLAFAPWPHMPATVLYDGDCGFCNRTRRVMERLDLEGQFVWKPFQTASDLHGVSEEALKQRLYVVAEDSKHSGFAAFKLMFLYNPLTYFALFFALSIPHWHLYQRHWLAIAVLAIFSPIFAPVGEMLYDLVARNRHRISQLTGGVSCAIEIKHTFAVDREATGSTVSAQARDRPLLE